MGYEKKAKDYIKELDKKGLSPSEISDKLVFDVGFTPEYSWKLVKNTLKLKRVM